MAVAFMGKPAWQIFLTAAQRHIFILLFTPLLGINAARGSLKSARGMALWCHFQPG
jgi:hypothetical protein